MSARRAMLAIAIALAALAALWTARSVLRPHDADVEPAAVAATRTSGTDVPAAPHAADYDWSPRAAERPIADPETEEQRAYRAGQAYAARWQAAVARMHELQFGAELARILALPIDEAWRALEARIAQGDTVAAAALRELVCPGPREVDASVFADHVTKELDRRAAAFVRGALAREDALTAARAEACARNGLGAGRLAELARLQWRARGEPVPAWLLEGTDAQFGAAHGMAREYAMFDAAFPQAQRTSFTAGPLDPLVRQVLDGNAPPLGTDAWIELIAAAGVDPSVAWVVGPCAADPNFCAAFPALDADQAQELVAYGAQAGSMSALSRVVQQHEDGGDLLAAYAWSLYQRWVSASGCSPMSLVWDFADASRRIATLEARLTPAQAAAGRAEANRLIAAYGAQMRAAFACPS